MKKWLPGALGAGLLALLVANAVLTRPAFDARLEGDPLAGLEILPHERGLSFARVVSGANARLVIVRRISAAGLHVVDVGSSTGRPVDDPIAALATDGFDALDRIARTGTEELIGYEALTVPLTGGATAIAAGTNYKAHADEVGLEDGPFLFPKLSAPTAWNAKVPARRRLDHEAELCAVPLSAVTAGAAVRFGYVLCNDFTDRWPLVRDMDFDRPMGTTGFPEAKGGPGMMPLGPFFIVPRDDASFYPDIELELYVNGALRQKSKAGLMIWSPREMARRALEACEQDYLHGDETLRLTPCESIPAGTILLTGTPGGVLFHPATIWNPFGYLRSGDAVVLRARYFGVLLNVVE